MECLTNEQLIKYYKTIEPNDEKYQYYSFMKNIDKRGIVRSDMSPCWRWVDKSFSSNGYGQLMVKCKEWNAHRYSYYIHNGFEEIPKGKHICHRCDNKECCNPEHLYCGTPAQNMKDVFDRGLRVKKEQKPIIRNITPCYNCVLYHKKCDNHLKEICSYCEDKGLTCNKKTDYIKHGFTSEQSTGENNIKAILTWDKVREIRKIYNEATKKYGVCKKLSEDYGVAVVTIHKIVKNKLWKE